MRGYRKNSTIVEISSGNVFADITIPDAYELKEQANAIHNARNGGIRLSSAQVTAAKKFSL
ncbi:hypothetical protein AT444_001015 [Escherichia coli]|uniref:hypothetical protein n=1 Tax=Enterobacterales TaxID=91347 RepID=UPI00071D87E6|nr:hypothetical protein [Salmonella enterica]EBM9474322.1 hypothetical protein [Salmonella enterica subsp. enterica serovar Rubislaw]EBP4160083.1 hypothetical protein [Salmonella enterica subsp. enterica]ECT6469590.1 hypothetical protein [Salmonella enterica subsp. enterica serovar Senegal]MBC1130697.1 hypothetical protein [Escherichia coli]EAQ5804278.1 hypothetical protein [Salmonella enterica]